MLNLERFLFVWPIFWLIASVAAADDDNIVFADENWLVTKQAAGEGWPICGFEHRTHEFKVVLGVEENISGKGPTPFFYFFTSVPDEFGSSVVVMGETRMPTPSSVSDLYVENGWANLELEYLSEIIDDQSARLVSQSLLGRLRAGQRLRIGEFNIALGSGQAAFSDANLKRCFQGRVTSSQAVRLGLPHETAQTVPWKAEVCDLVAVNSKSAIGAKLYYYEDSDTLTAVLISQHQYSDGKATYVDPLICEDGDVNSCVGGVIQGIRSDNLSYWKTELMRTGSLVEVVTNQFRDGTLSASTLDRDGHFADTYMIEKCAEQQLDVGD